MVHSYRMNIKKRQYKGNRSNKDIPADNHENEKEEERNPQQNSLEFFRADAVTGGERGETTLPHWKCYK